jgi:hypothetical protein
MKSKTEALLLAAKREDEQRPEVLTPLAVQLGDMFVFSWERCGDQWRVVSKCIVSPDGSVRQAWPPSDDGTYQG